MEILFRGKRVDNGEWVYGYYIRYEHEGVIKHIIVTNFAQVYVNSYYVIPETVGQYTGHDDKNGKRTFRGDVLVFDGDRFVILWDEERGGFMLDYWQFDEQYDFSELWPTSEVIGNIHDNPELLDG